METEFERRRWLLTLLIGTGAFVTYALRTAATPYLLDSAELAAASFGLGVAHPPGEALALLWGKAFCLLPLGSVAFRVGLSQALAGAVAVALVFELALRTSALIVPSEKMPLVARAPVAAGAALAFALAPGVIMSANRPEVYALQTALSLGALLLALGDGEAPGEAPGDARPVVLGALLIGLGVSNHPLVAGLVGLGAVVGALRLLRTRDVAVRLAAYAIPAFVVGTLVLAYAPLRAAALAGGTDLAGVNVDTVLWGDARTPRGLLWLLSAETFTHKARVVHQAARSADFPFPFMEELGLALAWAAPAGLFFLARRRVARLPAAALAVTWAGSLAAALVGGFDPANPDIRGYLGVALALMPVLAAVFLIVALSLIGSSRLRAAAACVVLVGLGAQALWPPARSDLHRARAADRMVGVLLEELPSRAALFTSHFETAFLVGYQRAVEGRRPDVAWAHLGFVRGPGYAERLAAAEPELGPVLEAHSRGPLPLEPVALLDRERPVRFEPDPHLSAEVAGRLTPAGRSWALGPGGAPVERAPPPVLPEEVFGEAATDRQVRGFATWHAFADASLACARGARATALARMADLDRLAPADATVRELLARCRK